MAVAGRLDSLAACVAYVLGIDGDEIPHEREVALRQWLSGRNFGLIQSEPNDSFTWPGHFFARLRDDGGWAVLFGAPPGVVWDPAGRSSDFDSLSETFDSLAFLVPYEIGAFTEGETTGTTGGAVSLIAVAWTAEAPMRTLDRAEAVSGRGLVGDRYEQKAGTFTDTNGRGNDLTLIESEALAELEARGVELSAADARRNIVTEGISLDALIGRRFRIGDVECFGQRRCEPCSHLQKLTGPGVLRGLVHRGGLRADVIGDGEIRIGDRIESL